MNDGTFRGGAQAFKLDTLLKLADVKGTDGKTTLLHFVVQEIIRSEGVRAVRMARESGSISSVNSDDLTDDSLHESEDYYCKLGLKVISRFVRLKHIMLDLPTVASVHPCRHGLGAFTVAALILIIATFIPTVAVLYSHHSGSVGFRHTLLPLVQLSSLKSWPANPSRHGRANRLGARTPATEGCHGASRHSGATRAESMRDL
ncbi:hypothetical protein GW17_00003340 [Ensete ventricosum]|nr:hypothetical protein GW17_00003340 [Ensete ventricosum]